MNNSSFINPLNGQRLPMNAPGFSRNDLGELAATIATDTASTAGEALGSLAGTGVGSVIGTAGMRAGSQLGGRAGSIAAGYYSNKAILQRGKELGYHDLSDQQIHRKALFATGVNEADSAIIDKWRIALPSKRP
uniref:Glycine zipper domain-containing protein n=1 Tax=Magnetococcus massalia (strain MO-1) TaxID=451514 RepID=A0A1S7LFA3_MAGMO|nr:protein of unknown function [Candidatus Magnetococcus massalia]